jgi:hypothetical protein
MLTQETFNAIVAYLATKPYQEVQPLFDMIIKDVNTGSNTETNIVEEVKD